MAMPTLSFEESSDELHEMFCESCKKHGEDMTADGFCVNCEEYLCTTCLKYHRRLMVGHVLQDKDSMPQDFCFEKCPGHQNEIIKFYCQTCDAFLCSACKEVMHKNCTEIKHLSTIVKDIEKGNEFRLVTKELSDLQQEVQISIEKSKSVGEHIEFVRNKCKSAIKMHREYLNNELDVQETKLDNEVERIRLKEETINKDVTVKNASLNADVAKLQSEMDSTSGNKCKLFMAMKKVQKRIQPLENEMKRITKENNVTKYIFKPEDKIKDALDSGGLGSLIKLDSTTKRTATFIWDINVKSPDDQEVCYITGMCSLSESLLVVTDYNNRCVKLIDKLSNVIRSVLYVDASPWDVTEMCSEEIAVTLLGKSLIRFISVQGDVFLYKHKDIKVKGDCLGIEQTDGNLIVSFRNPAEVQIIDKTGTILRSFTKDSSGNSLFTMPVDLAVSPDQSRVYVTDISERCIITLSLKGNDISVHQDESLQFPVGITTDRNGAVFVCDTDTGEVHHFSEDIAKVGVLIGKDQKLVNPVYCTVDEQTNTTFVCLKEHSVIKVFSLN